MIFSIMSWNMCIESKAAKRKITYVVGENGSAVLYMPTYSGETYSPRLITVGQTSTYSCSASGSNSVQFGERLEFGAPNSIPAGSVVNVKASFTFTSPRACSLGSYKSVLSSPTGLNESYVFSFHPVSIYSYEITYNSSFVLNVDTLMLKWSTFYSFFAVGDGPISGCKLTFNSMEVSYEVDETEKDVLEDIRKNTGEAAEEAKEQTETQKGIFASIKDFFASFFQNLIDSVISLFVPSSEEMSDLFGQLNDFFSDTFGFLYAPFDYLIQLIGVFTSSTGTTGLTLPGFSIMGHEVWGDQTYDISSDPVAGQVLGYVRIGTGVLLAGWFIMYLQDFFKERFGKG